MSVFPVGRVTPLICRYVSRDRPTGEVKVGDTSYFNIDHGVPFPETSLSVSHSGKVRAIPHSDRQY